VLAGVTLFALAAVCLLAGPTGPLLLGAALIVAETTGRFARRRLGGMTGDVYGAVEQLAETATLMLTPLILPR
jgi:adenosylcobinamide-GDP ribazoletransferase